jgi:hypothetical protein
MMDGRDLQDFIFKAALAGCGADVKAHKNAIWNACLAMMGDVLRETDPFNRERLLRGIEAELRTSIVDLDRLLTAAPSTAAPRNPFKLN